MEALFLRGSKISRISFLCEKLKDGIACLEKRKPSERCPTIFELGVCFEGKAAGREAEIDCSNFLGNNEFIHANPSRKDELFFQEYSFVINYLLIMIRASVA